MPFSNRLINESSPYLLQHAQNPVDWYPWGKEAFEKAGKENKLVLVSIGYSACHWCHVMEHESFENEGIASIMNKDFICIKVDREERPDIDQVYMNAVQLMSGQGGWPLNCFTLPDSRPVYGGTYFPSDAWINVLKRLSDLYRAQPEKMNEYAAKLTEGVKLTDIAQLNLDNTDFDISDLEKSVEKWQQFLDYENGGSNRAPKFPMPNNYQFLLRYAFLTDNELLKKQVNLTLEKMAFGGIYDQAGGGFARYSTDMLWKVPHFEKMLYDNAQLISLYAEAYQATGRELFKEIVYQTIEFIEEEMTSPESAFYSAIDADSEGKEGKFYVWKREELKDILAEDFKLIESYYNLNDKGLWEEENYILLRTKIDEEFAVEHNIELNELKRKISGINKQIKEKRAERVKPGLDDKSLTSWNAMMITGLADAYKVFDEPRFLELAERNARFILASQKKKDGSLFHSYKKGKSTIAGFLEDYAFSVEAFLRLYEVTFHEEWLREAKGLCGYVLEHFFDEETGMLFFTSSTEESLIARKMEISDNVIPASNSVIANSLFKLSRIYDIPEYEKIATKMLSNVSKQIADYGQGYSNWAMLLLNYTFPFFEAVFTGTSALKLRTAFTKKYAPNLLIAGSLKTSNLPLLRNRFNNGKDLIFVCENKSCQLPVSNANEAFNLIKNR